MHTDQATHKESNAEHWSRRTALDAETMTKEKTICIGIDHYGRIILQQYQVLMECQQLSNEISTARPQVDLANGDYASGE